MKRYVKQMVGRRDFNCFPDCEFDYQGSSMTRQIPDDTVAEARNEYYQDNLEDAMLKILFFERFSVAL